MAFPHESFSVPPGLDPFEGTPYRVLRRLRAGGMGEVFLVEHRATGRRVVAKLIHARLAENPAFIARLRIEAQSAAQVDHEYVVKILGFEMTRTGRPFLVMEYLEGRTLAEELAARGPLPVLEALTFTCHLLSALAAVHEKGFVHRDIKPDNLLVCPRGNGTYCLTLLDFGVVRVLPGSQLVEPLPHDYRTRTGVVVGTPRYVSPEGAMGQPVDPRGDLYAAGLVLWAMLVGHGPFDHLDAEQMLLTAHATEDPELPSRSSQNPIPPELDRALVKALAKDPAARFQTAEEFQHYLEQVEAALRRPTGWLETTAFSVDGARSETVAQPVATLQPSQDPRSAPAPVEPAAREARPALPDPAADFAEPGPVPALDAANFAEPDPESAPATSAGPRLQLSPAAAAVVFILALLIAGLAAFGLVSIVRGSP